MQRKVARTIILFAKEVWERRKTDDLIKEVRPLARLLKDLDPTGWYLEDQKPVKRQELMTQPPISTQNIILFGPPGAGKTFSTAKRTLELALGKTEPALISEPSPGSRSWPTWKVTTPVSACP